MALKEGDGGEWAQSLREKTRSPDKSWTVAFLCSVFLGMFGADRFYLGYRSLGFIKLMTVGGFCCWWAVDIALLLLNRLPDAQGMTLARPF
jgi:hypothetical protein